MSIMEAGEKRSRPLHDRVDEGFVRIFSLGGKSAHSPFATKQG